MGTINSSASQSPQPSTVQEKILPDSNQLPCSAELTLMGTARKCKEEKQATSTMVLFYCLAARPLKQGTAIFVVICDALSLRG